MKVVLLYYSYKSSRQTLKIGTNWKKYLVKFQATFQHLHLQQWDPNFVCMVSYLRYGSLLYNSIKLT